MPNPPRARTNAKMNEPDAIPRRRPDPLGLDFAGLKTAALEALQAMCGETWTDYNLHDPGITVLEQLCYALTEVKYRAEFDIADYLAGADGAIDFERLALYRPKDVLPSQAVTLADYRKLIVDRVPEIDNVWLCAENAADAPTAGLYRVFVRPRETPAAAAASDAVGERVLRRVREIYAANRNLGEDLREVRIVARRKVVLRGRIEIEGDRQPVEILARVYGRCARLIARGVEFLPFEDMLARGAPLERIFDGPPTAHGLLDEGRAGAARLSLVDLFGIIGHIEGVRHVEHLALEDERGGRIDSLRLDDFLDAVPYLAHPERDEEIGVRLFKSGRPHPVGAIALRAELDRQHAEYRPARRDAAELDRLSDLPTGTPRRFGEYFSIQHHFPQVYGIGAYGLPLSASPRRRAQAKQLKAYLLFFEQILANDMENLRQAGRLFSLDPDLDRSAFSQPLDDASVPDVEALYAMPRRQRGERVAAVLAKHDDFADRRNRVLDYLLGLHGESFSQRSLRHFDHYLTDGDADAELIRNKLALLESLVELSRDRAGAFNYRAPADGDGNRATLERKVGILLAMRDERGVTPSGVLRERGLRLVEDAAMPWRAVDVAAAGTLGGLSSEPPTTLVVDEAMLFREVECLRQGMLSIAMLHGGIDLERYRLAPTAAGFDVLLGVAEGEPWRRLATQPTRVAAVALARGLRDLLVQLNARSERMQLVEHILLRPRGVESFAMEVPADFHAFRMSAVFPAWTARCAEEKFRNLAEETVLLNCPAHLHADVLWLDFDAMREFEDLHAAWLAALRLAESAVDELDAASQRLIGFLLRHRAVQAPPE